MTPAISQPIQQQPISFDEFLTRYGDDNRYELIDGEVFDLEPTGPHEEVAAFITTKLCVQIDAATLSWFVLQRGLLRPPNTRMTAFRPDVAMIDRNELAHEPLWADQSILTLGSSIKFVAEVVSSNWQNDYARRVEDYAALGIPEYCTIQWKVAKSTCRAPMSPQLAFPSLFQILSTGETVTLQCFFIQSTEQL